MADLFQGQLCGFTLLCLDCSEFQSKDNKQSFIDKTFYFLLMIYMQEKIIV